MQGILVRAAAVIGEPLGRLGLGQQRLALGLLQLGAGPKALLLAHVCVLQVKSLAWVMV